MTVATLSSQQLTQTPLSYRKPWRCCASRSWQRCKVRSRPAWASATTADGNTGGCIDGLPLPMYCQHHTPLFLALHRAYLYYF